MTSAFRNILYDASDKVARICINRPPLKILNAETLIELNTALEAARNDSSVSVVVIRGAGDKAFCAGVDIKDHLPDKVGSTLDVFNRVFCSLERLDKPTVAVVQGFALGGGCELAIACDMIIASENAQFGQPEIKVGAIPPVAVALLPRLVGRKKAFELIMTGESIAADEAKRIGLVNSVVSPEKLEQTTDDMIGKLTQISPIVLRITRMALRESIDLRYLEGLDKVTDIYLNVLMCTEDAVEGIKAFLEKRKPQWKGK
jgi:cyclohexa-1,5-dienecarbonyl-CoA hydratase